ncbi:hypothetical protein POTOM_037188 [Populus tomentosa]|uniref:Uncharacterized protein n=1 Tax=Populus tomentosa TaxID=118781 RepID=A0A8X8CJW1_POPTO|nr:hypothetical protein POTOM_037188 [Populus tomentosa]
MVVFRFEREVNMWILFLYLGISKQSGMVVLVVRVEGQACKPHGQKGISMPANETELEAVKTSRGINLELAFTINETCVKELFGEINAERDVTVETGESGFLFYGNKE